MKITDEMQLVFTEGVAYEFGNEFLDLTKVIDTEYQKQPDVRTNGDNDKNFFVFYYKGKKLYASRNELNGLTIMFPNEY